MMSLDVVAILCSRLRKVFQQRKNFVAPKLRAVYGGFVIQNCYAICTALRLIRGEATLTGFEPVLPP